MTADGLAVAGAVQLGVMIEVPSAAVMADSLAEAADFFSIGTNDLVQYVMAVDRTNSELADLASALQPAVLRLIDGVVRAARVRGRHVAVCGEAAADPAVIPFLVGLGVTELSVGRAPWPRCGRSWRGWMSVVSRARGARPHGRHARGGPALAASRTGDASRRGRRMTEFVHEATVELADGADPRALGGAITVALCGHWEHEPPCRWPHHTDVTAAGGRVIVRTVFKARRMRSPSCGGRSSRRWESGEQAGPDGQVNRWTLRVALRP